MFNIYGPITPYACRTREYRLTQQLPNSTLTLHLYLNSSISLKRTLYGHDFITKYIPYQDSNKYYGQLDMTFTAPDKTVTNHSLKIRQTLDPTAMRDIKKELDRIFDIYRKKHRSTAA